MPDFDIALRMRDLDGTVLLDLEDEENGYVVPEGGMPTRDHPWLTRESKSPWVDGSSENGGTRDSAAVSIQVIVSGSSWAQVQGRVKAVTDITESGLPWLLEEVVEGVSTTWRAGRVSPLIPPPSLTDLHNLEQTVTLTFITQPTPSVTGI